MNNRIFACAILCWCLGQATFASDAKLQRQQLQESAKSLLESPAGPLCGAYATYRVLSALGHDCSLEQFVKRKFVSQCGGSTEQDIKEMVEDVGRIATISGNLSAYDLYLIGDPFIANVRSCPSAERFDHWVAVVPEQGAFTLLDGNDKPRKISAAEFSSLWRGSGVFVSQYAGVSWLLLLGRAGLIVGVVGIGLMLHSLLGKFVSQLSSVLASKRAQLTGILVVSCVLGFIGTMFFGDMRNYEAGRGLATAHVQSDFEHVPINDLLQTISDNSDFLLIDARRSSDFQVGSLPTAINLPVDASYWSLKALLRGVSRDTRFVVFCQSKNCDYDTTVARRLRSLGFANVAVSEGGWKEAQPLLASAPSASNKP